MIFIDVTSNVEAGEALRGDPSRWLRVQVASSLSPMVEMGQKGLSMVKVAQW